MVQVHDFSDMGEALGDAASVLRTNSASAGLDAFVPTCPGWRVRDLVAHTGMVYRWTTAYLTRSGRIVDRDVIAEAHAAPDLLTWFDDCLVAILNAFATLPADLEAKFFLPDAPPPRDAWLRRMVHETNIHGIDAMGARLGREPSSDQLWLRPWLSADGVDEVLTGHVTRPAERPVLDENQTVLVSATDVEEHWLLVGIPGAVATTRHDTAPDADVTLHGTATQLYAALWNRGSEVTASDADFLPQWRQRFQVTWS